MPWYAQILQRFLFSISFHPFIHSPTWSSCFFYRGCKISSQVEKIVLYRKRCDDEKNMVGRNVRVTEGLHAAGGAQVGGLFVPLRRGAVRRADLPLALLHLPRGAPVGLHPPWIRVSRLRQQRLPHLRLPVRERLLPGGVGGPPPAAGAHLPVRPRAGHPPSLPPALLRLRRRAHGRRPPVRLRDQPLRHHPLRLPLLLGQRQGCPLHRPGGLALRPPISLRSPQAHPRAMGGARPRLHPPA